MRRLKRRHITLLEVLIALFIISMCAVPLLAPHFRMFIHQRRFVDKIELDRAVSLFYGQIVEKLHQNQISWRELTGGQVFLLSKEQIKELIGKSLPFEGSYRFTVDKYKEAEKGGFSVYLIKLVMTFISESTKEKPLVYSYNILVARQLDGAPSEEDEEEEKEKKEDDKAKKEPTKTP